MPNSLTDRPISPAENIISELNDIHCTLYAHLHRISSAHAKLSGVMLEPEKVPPSSVEDNVIYSQITERLVELRRLTNWAYDLAQASTQFVGIYEDVPRAQRP